MSFNFDILGVAPHPDDLELFAGGFLAKAAAFGQKVAIADLTLGELSSNGTVEERKVESQKAFKILKLAHRENLELPDGGISHQEQTQIAKVVGLLRRVRAKVLLVPPEIERHPDHQEAALLLRRAIFFAGLAKYRPDLGQPYQANGVLSYLMRYAGNPTMVVDTSAWNEIKLQAIMVYGSQVSKVDGSVQTLVNSNLNVSSIQQRDGYFGAMIGTKFGEGFLSDSVIAIDDPVNYFDQHQNKNALFFVKRAT